MISCGFEGPLKCGSVWWSVKYRPPNFWPVYVVKAFLSCCQQLCKCLDYFFFFFVILQLPETKQLLRLRQYAHGTTALIFLTALSGKGLSAALFVTHSSLLAGFIFFCSVSNSIHSLGKLLLSGILQSRTSSLVLPGQVEKHLPAFLCCVLSVYVDKRNSGSS